MQAPSPAAALPGEDFAQQLATHALAGKPLNSADALRVLTDNSVDLMALVHAAYTVRHHHFGRGVQVHILNNAKNGHCSEDCSYCTQAKTSTADIEPYPIKDETEVLAEAGRAYDAGAHRYCMVFSGRGPTEKRTEQLASYVRAVKHKYPSLEVCVSAGLLDDDKAAQLKSAGLDRLNHNLNTSRTRYSDICSTHTYDDRINTLLSAKRVGLQTCSGIIAGMGESPGELVELARTLADLKAESIPVNFLLPFEGNVLDTPHGLTPDYCLRVLCLFRFANPAADVRCAAGREFHLRSLEPLSLLPANSLFLDGYLNGRGAERRRTYAMIADAGFSLVSDHTVNGLLDELPNELSNKDSTANDAALTCDGVTLKSMDELRPAAVKTPQR